jgi:glycosyltransferase involved in cell wall biosynthesis
VTGGAGEHRPLRVLVTGPDIAQSGGAGIQQHVRYLVAAFEHDPDIAVRPFAITTVTREEPWLLKGVRLLGKYLQLLFVVPAVDVVHVNSTIDNRSVVRDTGVVLIASMFGRPTVVQFHGGDAANLTTVRRSAVFRVARGALRRAAAVLFLSAEQGGPVVELFGLADARVHYVANYVPVDDYEYRPGAPMMGLHVLYLGRLHESKGVLEAVRAFGSCAEDGWTMRVAGAGPLQREVESAIALTPGAEYVGFAQGAEKRELLAASDVFVLPSAHFEGMPYGALEALASGLALVASANAGLARLVRDGWNGIVVPPLDTAAIAAALARLGDDRALLERMRANSRELAVGEYSLERGRQLFLALYRSAASRGSA